MISEINMTWSLDVNDTFLWRQDRGVPELCPFFKTRISILWKFASQIFSTVLKSSNWNLPPMIHMMCRCAWHIFLCDAAQFPELYPFSKIKSCYIWSLWYVDVHDIFCETRPRGLRVMPFFKIPKYPYWVSLCLKLLPQFSSHLTKTCCTLFLWYIDVNDIFVWRAGSRVAELCPFFKFLSNPYWDSLCLKLLPQFSSHLLKLAVHCVYESCEISATR